jgi:hypothetical protein
MKKRNSIIHLSFEFSGALLPVVQDDDGNDLVPLKPVSDLIGLHWETQRLKVQGGFLKRRLGTCTTDIRGADQQREMVCIRLDKVIAFLSAINPDQVRAHGNIPAADFLEAKIQEWDAVLDCYERGVGTLIGSKKKVGKPASVRDFLSILKAKKAATTESERQVLDKMARTIADDLGAPFQMELTAKERA